MENAEKLKSSLKKADTVYSGSFTALSFHGGPFVLSPMEKHSRQVVEYVNNISRHTAGLLNVDGGMFALYGEWSCRRGERCIFTYFIWTVLLSQLASGVNCGMIAAIARVTKGLETRLTLKSAGGRRIVMWSQSTWENILQNRMIEIRVNKGEILEGGGENGTSRK